MALPAVRTLLVSTFAACGLLLVATSAGAEEPSTARVHLNVPGDVPVVLEMQVPGTPLWRVACTAPCDVDVLVDRDYRVSAPGIRTSAWIRLAPPPNGPLVLDVHPVSKTVHTTGLVLVGVGIVAFIAGDAMSDVVIGFKLAQLVDHSPPPQFSNDLILPGIVIASVGAAAFLTGGGMYLATRTPTTVVPAAIPTDTGGPGTAQSRSGPALPSATNVPVMSLRF